MKVVNSWVVNPIITVLSDDRVVDTLEGQSSVGIIRFIPLIASSFGKSPVDHTDYYNSLHGLLHSYKFCKALRYKP